MPSVEQLRTGLWGAWRLALLDRGGMKAFDRSAAAVWQSFQAVFLLCAAPTLLTILLDVPAAKVSHSGWPTILAVEAIAYVVRLVAFPLLMAQFCRWLDRDQQFVPFVVAYNWISVIQTALYLAAALLSILIPDGGIILLAALLASMAYEWFTVTVALEVAALPATTIVLLDFVISLLVSRITDSLY